MSWESLPVCAIQFFFAGMSTSVLVCLTVFVLLFRFSLGMFGDDRRLPQSDSGLQYLPSLQDHEPKFMLEISSSHKNLSLECEMMLRVES